MQALPHNNTLRPQNTATAAGTWCFLLVCALQQHTHARKGWGLAPQQRPALGCHAQRCSLLHVIQLCSQGHPSGCGCCKQQTHLTTAPQQVQPPLGSRRNWVWVIRVPVLFPAWREVLEPETKVPLDGWHKQRGTKLLLPSQKHRSARDASTHTRACPLRRAHGRHGSNSVGCGRLRHCKVAYARTHTGSHTTLKEGAGQCRQHRCQHGWPVH